MDEQLRHDMDAIVDGSPRWFRADIRDRVLRYIEDLEAEIGKMEEYYLANIERVRNDRMVPVIEWSKIRQAEQEVREGKVVPLEDV